jgi:hypothetical protein
LLVSSLAPWVKDGELTAIYPIVRDTGMFLFLYFISTDGTASILFRKLSIQAQHVQAFHVGNDELSG